MGTNQLVMKFGDVFRSIISRLFPSIPTCDLFAARYKYTGFVHNYDLILTRSMETLNVNVAVYGHV